MDSKYKQVLFVTTFMTVGHAVAFSARYCTFLEGLGIIAIGAVTGFAIGLLVVLGFRLFGFVFQRR